MNLADVVLPRLQTAAALRRDTVLSTLRAARGRPVERKTLLALCPPDCPGWLDRALAALLHDGQVIRKARGQYAAVVRSRKGQP